MRYIKHLEAIPALQAASDLETLQAVDERHIYLRNHRAKDPALRGRFMIYHRNDAAYWLDDLVPVDPAATARFAHDSPFETEAGPE